jgi:hypothetical protein
MGLWLRLGIRGRLHVKERMARQRFASWHLGITPVILLVLSGTIIGRSQVSQPQEAANEDKPQSIYAENSNDAWNRIFYCLFSRRVKTRYSSEFHVSGPFASPRYAGVAPNARYLQVSARLFERFETGDRAIDPLYPIDRAYPSPYLGASQVLDVPFYTQLTEALQEAQNDNTERPILARALMQSDLWSAFDILYAYPLEHFEEHRRILLDMLAHFIKKIALTPAEVEALPDNYTFAMGKSGLPDLFNRGGGWMEVQWFPTREHDIAAGFRRVTRVFIKPAGRAMDAQKFLDSLRSSDGQNLVASLDGVAIVIQLLLIDCEGRLTPSPVTSDVQLRMFEKTRDGHFKTTEMQEYELSRRLILNQHGSGGFNLEDDTAPAYLPAAGSYGFASRQFTRAAVDPPLLVKLRTRCGSCHGSDSTQVFTFARRLDPTVPTLPVRQLNMAVHEAADYVMSQKVAREDWKALRQYFNTLPPG